MVLSAKQGACFIYGVEVTDDNARESLDKLARAGLEPVTLVNGDPMVVVSISTKKVNMESWMYKRLLPSAASNDDTNCAAKKASREAVLEVCLMIFPTSAVPTITERKFLTEQEVFDTVTVYLPGDSVDIDVLTEWMAKDGSWGSTKQLQHNNVRRRGHWYNAVSERQCVFTWESLPSFNQYRYHVHNSADRVCTIGYVRKSSNRNEMAAAKTKSINLQIFKLKNKLLCQEVFVSVNTAAYDAIQSRDCNHQQFLCSQFVGCAGTTQGLPDKIMRSSKKIRLVVIDFAGLSTNVDDLERFIRSSKNLAEVVVDLESKVEIFTRHDLLHKDDLLANFNCRV